jgi:hypothetical protein
MPGYTPRSGSCCVSPPWEVTPAQAMPPDRDGIRLSYADSCDESHPRWHPATLQERSTSTRCLRIALQATHAAVAISRPRALVGVAVEVATGAESRATCTAGCPPGGAAASVSPAASSLYPRLPITVPIILDVPAVGSVEVSEEEYARLFKRLSSSDQAQIDGAIALLRAIKAAKAAKDAEVEAAHDGERDLSEPISFGRPSKITEPSRRLY